MKKILLVLITVLTVCPKLYAAQSDNIALLEKKGFFDRPQQTSFTSPYEEVKKTLYTHLKYANNYTIDGLKSLYSDKYINADGLDKNIYFSLIKKTWDSYPDIKYKIDIKSIEINGNIAVADVDEEAVATTNTKSGLIKERGLLESFSDSVYYFENVDGQWLITSDHINFEKTFLRYGSAKNINVDLIAPCQILANKSYTASLKLITPKDSLAIASIGQEQITYPQQTAEEIFRKLPDDDILERVFTSNNKNINEYAVASFGITKADLEHGKELKVYVTGLGFVMSRINVIPENKFIKADENEKTK
jgi:hypothetical protein